MESVIKQNKLNKWHKTKNLSSYNLKNPKYTLACNSIQNKRTNFSNGIKVRRKYKKVGKRHTMSNKVEKMMLCDAYNIERQHTCFEDKIMIRLRTNIYKQKAKKVKVMIVPNLVIKIANS